MHISFTLAKFSEPVFITMQKVLTTGVGLVRLDYDNPTVDLDTCGYTDALIKKGKLEYSGNP